MPDKDAIKKEVGQRLGKIRRDRNMTIKGVAKYIGVGVATVGRYERGETAVPVDKLVLLAYLFRVPSTSLMPETAA